ncbi:MAG: signal peptidase II [Acidimicrobiales bacterium]
MQERGAAPTLSGGQGQRGGIRRLLVAVAVAGCVVVADQLTKWWATDRLARGPVHVVGKLDLVLSYNSGATFGLAQGWAPVVSGVALALVVGLVATLRRVRTTGLAVALGLILGGALGNLADRAFRGHGGSVVDFVALHFWPTFNVADSCIVVGVALAVVSLWRADAAAARAAPPPDAVP